MTLLFPWPSSPVQKTDFYNMLEMPWRGILHLLTLMISSPSDGSKTCVNKCRKHTHTRYFWVREGFSKEFFMPSALTGCTNSTTETLKIKFIYVVFLWACFVTAYICSNLNLIYELKASFCHNYLAFNRLDSFSAHFFFSSASHFGYIYKQIVSLWPCCCAYCFSFLC